MHIDEWLDKRMIELEEYIEEERDTNYVDDLRKIRDEMENAKDSISYAWSDVS